MVFAILAPQISQLQDYMNANTREGEESATYLGKGGDYDNSDSA